ncbi:MAG TPA: hypothetical protein ENN91_03920, partial [Firmicutes bacterium]|nr:hypothetical protein [Bacillota bacterium]
MKIRSGGALEISFFKLVFRMRKGRFIVLPIPIILFIFLVLIWFVYRKQWQNLVRPLQYKAAYSGMPAYIAGSTNGSPLSELGSHCGFKAVLENEAAACSALYATVTSFGAGRITDFALRLYTDEGKKYFTVPRSRT